MSGPSIFVAALFNFFSGSSVVFIGLKSLLNIASIQGDFKTQKIGGKF
jgi:hypothetical protein